MVRQELKNKLLQSKAIRDVRARSNGRLKTREEVKAEFIAKFKARKIGATK